MFYFAYPWCTFAPLLGMMCFGACTKEAALVPPSHMVRLLPRRGKLLPPDPKCPPFCV